MSTIKTHEDVLKRIAANHIFEQDVCPLEIGVLSEEQDSLLAHAMQAAYIDTESLRRLYHPFDGEYYLSNWLTQLESNRNVNSVNVWDIAGQLYSLCLYNYWSARPLGVYGRDVNGVSDTSLASEVYAAYRSRLLPSGGRAGLEVMHNLSFKLSKALSGYLLSGEGTICLHVVARTIKQTKGLIRPMYCSVATKWGYKETMGGTIGEILGAYESEIERIRETYVVAKPNTGGEDDNRLGDNLVVID